MPGDPVHIITSHRDLSIYAPGVQPSVCPGRILAIEVPVMILPGTNAVDCWCEKCGERWELPFTVSYV